MKNKNRSIIGSSDHRMRFNTISVRLTSTTDENRNDATSSYITNKISSIDSIKKKFKPMHYRLGSSIEIINHHRRCNSKISSHKLMESFKETS